LGYYDTLRSFLLNLYSADATGRCTPSPGGPIASGRVVGFELGKNPEPTYLSRSETHMTVQDGGGPGVGKRALREWRHRGGGYRIPRARRLLRYSYETGTTELVMDELFYAPHPPPSGAKPLPAGVWGQYFSR